MIRREALLGSLALCLLWAVQPAAGQGNFFNMDFAYGFFDDIMPGVDPNSAELFALVCQTEDFLSGALQNGTENPCVHLSANNIAYTRNATGNSTYEISFVGDISTWDGSPNPSADVITTLLDPLQNPDLNTQTYISQFIYAAMADNGTTNYWIDVDRMNFSGIYQRDPYTGAFPDAGCEPVIPQICKYSINSIYSRACLVWRPALCGGLPCVAACLVWP